MWVTCATILEGCYKPRIGQNTNTNISISVIISECLSVQDGVLQVTCSYHKGTFAKTIKYTMLKAVAEYFRRHGVLYVSHRNKCSLYVQLLTITLFELTEEHRISEQLIYNYVSVEATRHGIQYTYIKNTRT